MQASIFGSLVVIGLAVASAVLSVKYYDDPSPPPITVGSYMLWYAAAAIWGVLFLYTGSLLTPSDTRSTRSRWTLAAVLMLGSVVLLGSCMSNVGNRATGG